MSLLVRDPLLNATVEEPSCNKSVVQLLITKPEAEQTVEAVSVESPT